MQPRGQKRQHRRLCGQPKAAAWQDRAVRLSTFPHLRVSTAIQWSICAFIQMIHRSTHRSLLWLARAGVIGASSHAGPGICCERGAYDKGTRPDSRRQGHYHVGPRRGRQRHVRWHVYTHVAPDRSLGGENWGQGRGLAIGPSKPRAGTGCVGLALAPPATGNCAASGTPSGTRGGLASGMCARNRRRLAGEQRLSGPLRRASWAHEGRSDPGRVGRRHVAPDD
jgi:hypothetical protein